MFKFIKKWFSRKKPVELELVPLVALPPEPPLVATPPEPPRVVVSEVTAPAAISRREARLKRLLAISNPPPWVLAEISELQRID